MLRTCISTSVLGLVCAALLSAQVASTAFVNFEASQTNPVRLSPDGTRLFAVNTADARLSVFDISQPASPKLLVEIPVGLEPVSVNPLSSDVAWVVNQVSDSVSVISVSKGIVTDTIYTPDEPADVVFAGANRAFVSAARSNQIKVFDTNTHALVSTIALKGENPRSLAVNAQGTKVYAAFALSGNRTTLVPTVSAPPQSAPTNTALPTPPRVGLIVDAADSAWTSVIKYTMPDNDVAEVDVSALAVSRYFSRVGTINLGLAVHPVTGDLFVANSDARNLVHFEPTLRGHTHDHRISRISFASGAVTPVDLNPGLNYSTLPNTPALSTAVAQPAGLAITPDGAALYIASFGTDRIVRLNLADNSMTRIDVGAETGATVDPRNKRGPRGLALNSSANMLYVMNRLSNTISVVSTASNTVLSEIPVGAFDPTPTVIRSGRGFLYDAKLSGNGTIACASCHIDSDIDLLAWDLGNPAGAMATVTQGSNTFSFHPMKGPMTTQTLRGINGNTPLHWRGDKSDFLAFAGAFNTLLGGATLSTTDMTAFRDFVNTLPFQPNPNQKLDRTLPTTFNGGDPNAGRNTFVNEQFASGITCNTCHTANPAPGTNNLIFSASLLQVAQSMKVPHLRNMYQKVNMNTAAGAASVGGFGFEHDGNIPSLSAFLSQSVFGTFATDTVRKNNLMAYMLCFDTGVAPAVGYSRTLTAATVATSAATSDWTLLQSQAKAGNADLIVKGTVDGQLRGLVYRPATNDYLADRTGVGPFTQAQLAAKIQAGDTLTLMGVPPGSGTRMGVDRNLDGKLDGN